MVVVAVSNKRHTSFKYRHLNTKHISMVSNLSIILPYSFGKLEDIESYVFLP